MVELENMARNVVVLMFVIYRLISTVGLTVESPELLRIGKDGGARFSVDSGDIMRASVDYGGMSRVKPMAVMQPGSAGDVANLIRAAYDSAQGFSVSARGHGHSINGQASAPGGVVIEMSHSPAASGALRSVPVYSPTLGGYYVDVWGGELWIDVLNWTLEHGGLAPKSWTDYLYLSVGGTLSNAGISGQAFDHGPQISNVYELDVVTGKGEVVTCSEKQNEDLFHGVLGGLGQFGIITRARIALETAPKRVRWIRVLYADFAAFTRDQERLISLHSSDEKFDYVEGFVITDENLINNWRSSFFSPGNPIKLSSLGYHGKVLYCLEVTKNYDDASAGTVDQEVEALLKELKFIPGTTFTTDIAYTDFLDRVHKAELKLRAKGLWEVPHPWLNLFVPASRIRDFDRAVFKQLLDNRTTGPVLIYPMNNHKWDERSSAVMPDEDVFYLVGLLWSVLPDPTEPSQTLQHMMQQNERILEYCTGAGIEVKQYLTSYETQAEWARHFGRKWDRFVELKTKFDPKSILAVGQRIFEPMGSQSSLLPFRDS